MFLQKNWVGVCGALRKTLTLFMTKICISIAALFMTNLASKKWTFLNHIVLRPLEWGLSRKLGDPLFVACMAQIVWSLLCWMASLKKKRTVHGMWEYYGRERPWSCFITALSLYRVGDFVTRPDATQASLVHVFREYLPRKFLHRVRKVCHHSTALFWNFEQRVSF